VLAACAAPRNIDDPAIVPPVLGRDAIEAWFDADHYQQWTCEPAAHDARAPSPHGRVRLCANPIAAGDPRGVDALDASLVLEIRDAGDAIVGRGAQRHTGDGQDAASWYWYMRVPPTSATVHDASGLAADGWGQEGPAATYCSACHGAAGRDSPGRDFVFAVPVPDLSRAGVWPPGVWPPGVWPR
jgi:cytochrome c553